MGLRGPLPRKQQENLASDAPEPIKAPRWLVADTRKLFRGLVDDLTAARVPIKAVDAHSIAMAAHCLQQSIYWIEQQSVPDMPAEYRQQCAALVARFERDLKDWMAAIGATVKSRAQMGLKGKEQPKVTGALAVMAARRQQTA